MSQEKHKQLVGKVNSGKFSEFDAVTFDKDGLCVTVSGKEFQKLASKNANFPQNEKVVDDFSHKLKTKGDVKMNGISEQISLSKFSYEMFWNSQEPMQRPHKKRAEELGLSIDDIPVSPVLTKLRDTMQRLDQMYNLKELEENKIDVRAMLTYLTEQELIEELEERGVEQSVTLGETEALLVCEEWQAVLQIPIVAADFFDLRQMEEISPGHYADISAFNTEDYLRNVAKFEFDKYRYFTDKVADRAEDLAIMHSCIASEEGRNQVKQRFIALVNSKYRNYALRLAAMHNASEDEAKRAELFEKVEKQNKQIRRLKRIWKKFAYVE